MKLHVYIGTEEAVEDWVEFREVFLKAAADLGLDITEIVHKRMEDKRLPLARPAAYGMIWNHVADPASAPLASQRFQYLLPKKDETAAVARRALTEVASGATSAGALVRRLNEEGVPAPQGGVWTRAGLAVILHNPVYCGLEATGRTRRPVIMATSSIVSTLVGSAIASSSEPSSEKPIGIAL